MIAEKLFGSLAHLTTSQLPQSRLLSLIGDSRYDRHMKQIKAVKYQAQLNKSCLFVFLHIYRRKNSEEKSKKSEGKHERFYYYYYYYYYYFISFFQGMSLAEYFISSLFSFFLTGETFSLFYFILASFYSTMQFSFYSRTSFSSIFTGKFWLFPSLFLCIFSRYSLFSHFFTGRLLLSQWVEQDCSTGHPMSIPRKKRYTLIR